MPTAPDSDLLFYGNPLPMWIYDVETCLILDVNEAALRGYCYSRAEFLTRSIYDLHPADTVPALRELLSRPLPDLSYSGIWPHQRKGGARLDMRVQSKQLQFQGRQARLVVAQDVTAEQELRRELERSLVTEQLARREAELERSHLKELFRNAPAMMAVTSGPEHRFIEMNESYEEFTGEPDLLGQALLEAFPLLAGSGLQQRLDRVYATGEPYVASEELILVPGPDGEPVEVYRNLIYKATRDAAGAIMGVFILAHDVTELVQSRAQLNGRQLELEQLNEELRAAYDTTIEGWARALDLKDHDTEGHSRRVTDLTVQLARHLGYPEGEIVHLRRGALLHDIGKIGIPESILRKPGKLDEDEWVLMREHPNLAKKVLSEIPFLKPALDIPLYHHEKWDGSGYPHGLRGEQIPLAARMFAVIDVYDALVSDRPYRLAMDHSEALEIIEDQAGQHFDPRVVKAFVSLV